MVNEIAGVKDDEDGNKKIEAEPWTIPLGKHVNYNPSPFTGQDDFKRKTLLIVILIIGAVIIIILWPSFQIFGILILGSALFCYGLSIYETRLFDDHSRHELR